MPFDLILRGGRVIDPSQKLDAVTAPDGCDFGLALCEMGGDGNVEFARTGGTRP